MRTVEKRTLILDAMQALLAEGRAGTASVSDIARQAGIAKGGMYYYFRSKEEVLDALVERTYQGIMDRCREAVDRSGLDALSKLALLLREYRSATVDANLDAQLHAPENAAIHQKSLAKILCALSPIVAGIIAQGVAEGAFLCAYPEECAEIIVSVFAFLLDPGIFQWSAEQVDSKLRALALLLEKGLEAEEGSFAFLYSTAYGRRPHREG